jgi:nucleoside-diphosphate-sugar epimerase
VTAPGRVLVTGAGGRIGRAVTALLTARGSKVTALSLDYPEDGLGADRILVGSTTDEQDVAGALDDVDAVVHLAAIPHRDRGTPHDVYVTNVNSTFTVLTQAAERGIRRAVIASSINAFGVPMNPHDVMPSYFPIDEEIETDIGDWYSLSKRSDELTAAMVARRWGMAVVAFRFPRVDTEAGLRAAAERAAAGPEHAAREGWSYLDVRDAAEAVYLALVAPVEGAVVLGLSAPDTLLPEPTAGLLDRYAPSVPLRSPLHGRQPLIDARKAVDSIGFVPRHSIHSSAPITSDPRSDENHA